MSAPGPVRGGGREAMPVLAAGSMPPGVGMVAGPAAVSRSLHVELHTQQRRLRHLRSIAARNIASKNGYRLLDTYFSLHLCEESRVLREFYKSEVVKDSLNPTWRSLDFGLMPDRLDTSVSCFVVRIWGGKNEDYRLLIEWKVNLDGLKYLGPQIRACNPNEIIFGLNDGYYGASFESKSNTDPRRNSHLQVEQNAVRSSYGVFSLLSQGTGGGPSSQISFCPYERIMRDIISPQTVTGIPQGPDTDQPGFGQEHQEDMGHDSENGYLAESGAAPSQPRQRRPPAEVLRENLQKQSEARSRRLFAMQTAHNRMMRTQMNAIHEDLGMLTEGVDRLVAAIDRQNTLLERLTIAIERREDQP